MIAPVTIVKFGQMGNRRAELDGRRVGPIMDLLLIAKLHSAIRCNSKSTLTGFHVNPDRLRG